MNKAAAEALAYDWACERITTGEAKSGLKALGYDVDFRQPDLGNWLEAAEIASGKFVRLEV